MAATLMKLVASEDKKKWVLTRVLLRVSANHTGCAIGTRQEVAEHFTSRVRTEARRLILENEHRGVLR